LERSWQKCHGTQISPNMKPEPNPGCLESGSG
jgi:hypothetical protein